jgi:hypothetical protein
VPGGAVAWIAASGERVRSPPMKKLVILIVIIALGAIAAQRLRSA